MGIEAYFALKTQIQKDSSSERLAQFSFVLSRRPMASILYQLASALPTAVGGVVCLMYAAAVSARDCDFDSNAVIAVEKFANEKKQIDMLWPVLRELGFVRWAIRRDFLFSVFYFFRRAITHPVAAIGTYRIARELFRRHELFQAMRACETLLSYFFFRDRLREKQVRMIVSSSDGNPYGRALMAAASAMEVPYIFISHGAIAANPVKAKATLALLHGQAAAEDFIRQGSQIGDILLLGNRMDNSPRRGEGEQRILVCLGAAANLEALQVLALEIRGYYPSAKLLVRPHPHAQAGEKELIEMSQRNGWEISREQCLDSELSRCDLAFAANSTVHLEILAAGLPSFYVAGLDPAGASPPAFIQDGLVAPWESFKEGDEKIVQSARFSQQERLGYYMSQEKNSGEFLQEFRRRLITMIEERTHSA